MPLRPDVVQLRARFQARSSAVVQVAGERGKSVAKFSYDRSKGVEFSAETFVALLKLAIALELAVACFDEAGDLIERESIADRE